MLTLNGISEHQARSPGLYLNGLDKYTDHSTVLTKYADADVTVSITLSLPDSKTVGIHWGDGSRSDVVGAVTDQAYTHTYGSTAADYTVKFTGDVDSLTKFKPSGSSNKFSGDIASFQYLKAATYISVSGILSSGDIVSMADLPLTYINGTSSSLSGDIADLATATIQTFILRHTSVSGDISALIGLTSATSIYLDSTTCTYTTATLPSQWDSCNIWVHGLGWAEATVDLFLADLDTMSTASTRTLNISGSNAAPSAAGVISKNSLIAKGWTVTTS